MENYQLFMIAERQHRIEINKQVMQKLKMEIERIKPRYENILHQISFLKIECSKLEQQLKTLNQDYEKNKDKRILYYKSDYIQSLSEEVERIEEQIQFTSCLKNSNKRSIRTFLTSFNQFSHYQKQVAQEEKGENISFFQIVHKYMKQYCIFKKNELSFPETNDTVSDILLKYEYQKETMFTEIERLNTELEERRNLIATYPKKKAMIQSSLQELTEEIDRLSNSYDCITYKQKIQEFSELDILNQNYQGQIDKIKEIGQEQNHRQQKKCA